MKRKWYLVLVAMAIAIATHIWFGDRSLMPNIAAVTQSPTWQSVKIGGGGYITGIYPHPQAADVVYIRTDNGGFYRWQNNSQRWLPITSNLPDEDWDYDRNSGGEAIGLDPQDPDTVLIAVGKYTDKPGTIFTSGDRGNTWQASDLQVAMGGDEEKRWGGNRLAVSPHNSNLVLFGSRRDGLWRSLDGGLTWHQLQDLAVDPGNHIGVLNVAFDPQQPNLIYASVYRDGIYQSQDNGQTWEKLANSPRKVMQLQVAKDGVVYATSDEAPQVSKYQDSQWQNISPGGFIGENFNALSLHPTQPKTLIVSEGEKGRAKIFYSQNGGNTWQKKSAVIENRPSWLASEFFNDHPSAIAFDPQNPQQVWLTDWFSVWHTENINKSLVKWSSRVEGIEQTVLFSLLSPPQGAILLSGIADQDGFYHQDLTTSPQSRFGFQRQGFNLSKLNLTGDRYLDNFFQDTFHLAYCQNAPQNIVRVGGQRWRNTYMGVTSQDGGKTWQPWANIPQDKLLMRVAIATDNPQHFLVTASEDLPLVTQDGGETWQEVKGLPPGETGPWNWNQPLAADGANGDRFYYYDRGKVYSSNDGGITFQASPQDLPIANRFVLTTVPNVEGEVWLSLNTGGLFHSLNGGRFFESIASITDAYLVTVGLPINSNVNSSIYVYGKTSTGNTGLFISGDRGNNWQQISSRADMPRSTKILVASQQRSGLIFAGTDGRGIYYQQIIY